MSGRALTNIDGSLSSVCIAEVWERLGGGELRNGRGRAFWRDGDGFNVALDRERGCWFDHAAGVGGGIVALVQTALDSDQRAALSWLIAEGFLEGRTYNLEERRAYSELRYAASVVASDIENWRSALAEELNARKEAASEAGDFEALAAAARLCFVLECGTAGAVAREFFCYRQANREKSAVLIEAGRVRSEEARRLAAVIVALMALPAESQASGVA